MFLSPGTWLHVNPIDSNTWRAQKAELLRNVWIGYLHFAGCNGMLPLSATLCCHWRHFRRTINPAARCNPILPFNSKRSRLPNPAVRGGMAAPVGETGSKVRFARHSGVTSKTLIAQAIENGGRFHKLTEEKQSGLVSPRAAMGI